MRLGAKIVGFTVAAILACASLLAVTASLHGKARILRAFTEDSLKSAGIVARSLADDLYFYDVRLARLKLEVVRSDPHIAFAYALDRHGQFVADGTKAPQPDERLGHQVVEMARRSGDWHSHADDDMLLVAGPVRLADEDIVGYVGLGFSLEKPQQRVSEEIRSILAAAALFTVIGSLFATVLARRISRPLQSVSEAADRLGRGDFSARVNLRRRDEIGSLADSINIMATHLAALNAERQRHELALTEARDRATAANEAKSRFLAQMTHELRTPLNAVVGFAQIMRGEIWGPLGKDRYRGYVKNIDQAGTHLVGLINNLLDLSKIEAGKMPLHIASVDIDEVIAYCRSQLEEQAGAAGLMLRVEQSPNLPVLEADEQMLRQMLLNLLSNAIKFTPAGGSIEISTAADHQGLTVSVSDTGIGIPIGERERVLRPFDQGSDVNTRRNTMGTGLGLPIAKQLVELHSGTLSIDDNPGSGTRITLWFPAYRCRAAAPPQQRTRSSQVMAARV